MKLHKLKVLSLLTLVLLGNKVFSADNDFDPKKVSELAVEEYIARAKAAEAAAKVEKIKEDLQNFSDVFNGKKVVKEELAVDAVVGNSLSETCTIRSLGDQLPYYRNLFIGASVLSGWTRAWEAWRGNNCFKNIPLAAASFASAGIMACPSIHENYPIASSVILCISSLDMMSNNWFNRHKASYIIETEKKEGNTTEVVEEQVATLSFTYLESVARAMAAVPTLWITIPVVAAWANNLLK